MDIRRGELKEFAESHIEYINPLGGWKAQRCVNMYGEYDLSSRQHTSLFMLYTID